MLIDTHCHLNFHAFEKDLLDVVRRAKEKGVEKMIIPGTDLASSRRAIEIAQAFPECYAAVGIHPHHAQDPNLTIDDNLKQELSKLLSQNRVVAVGEIGLDNYQYKKTKYSDSEITNEIKLKQKELLKLQLELALIHKLPVILHCREAHDEIIQTVSAFSRIVRHNHGGQQVSATAFVKTNYIKQGQLHGVWHCFGGNAKQLQEILTMGYYIGFDGNITYSSALRDIVRATPLDCLLLETDSPFLTPIPYRGKRNEPSYLPLVAQTVANYHSTSLSDVIHISTRNAQELFKL